jgi:hypothetical protein
MSLFAELHPLFPEMWGIGGCMGRIFEYSYYPYKWLEKPIWFLDRMLDNLKPDPPSFWLSKRCYLLPHGFRRKIT